MKNLYDLNISFIGAGRVGTAFGMYLREKGISVKGYFSIDLNDAKIASLKTNSHVYEDLRDLVCSSDIIFITTNDDSIVEVKCQLLEQAKDCLKDKLVIHMSGSYSSDILRDLVTHGCFTFSMHPLQSFSDIDNSVSKLHNTVFTIEGDIEEISILESILDKTQNKFFKIETDNKELYHVGACVLSNYLVTLIDIGLDFFKEAGINEIDALEAVSPLIDGTIENIKQFGTKEALTGPIARGDTQTIKNHLRSIEESACDKLSFYKLMALETLKLSQNSSNKISEITDIINQKR